MIWSIVASWSLTGRVRADRCGYGSGKGSDNMISIIFGLSMVTLSIAIFVVSCTKVVDYSLPLAFLVIFAGICCGFYGIKHYADAALEYQKAYYPAYVIHIPKGSMLK
jgi:hypothetical protein